MNGVLLGRIAETVGPTDDLWVLGDLCFDANAYERYRAWLLGVTEHLHLLQGNHDPKRNRHTRLLAYDFSYAHRHFYLCHYPWATWRPNTVMLHGHCHGNTPAPSPDPRQQNRFDVGVDCWDFRPVALDDLPFCDAGPSSPRPVAG
jgi:calcineurin-like phosphoesterase family protein